MLGCVGKNMNTTKTEWLTDSNGNKCSVEYFGSKEKAQVALDSLKNCKNCTNCSRCSGCSGCSRCSDCSDCSRCSGCSGCSGLTLNKPSKILEPLVIPKIENIHSKVLAAVLVPDALEMKTWHTCGTTHCRAGWVVTLAGEEGKKLEEFHNTELAASLIYRESSPHKVSCARFYDNNVDAMADIKRMAELEKS